MGVTTDYETDHSHYHCWDTENGQQGHEKHLTCCLCRKQNPATLEDKYCHYVEIDKWLRNIVFDDNEDNIEHMDCTVTKLYEKIHSEIDAVYEKGYRQGRWDERTQL